MTFLLEDEENAFLSISSPMVFDELLFHWFYYVVNRKTFIGFFCVCAVFSNLFPYLLWRWWIFFFMKKVLHKSILFIFVVLFLSLSFPLFSISNWFVWRQLSLTSNVSTSDYNMGYCLTGTLERGYKSSNKFQQTHFVVVRRRWPATKHAKST